MNWLGELSSGTWIHKENLKKKQLSGNVTMHGDPPLDNHVTQCTLHAATFSCWWPIVAREVEKPSSCQILTSPPVQSEAAPGKQGGRQWWLMPSGRWLWELAGYLRPSRCSYHLSPSPAATFHCPHVVAENGRSCSPGIALQRQSGTRAWPAAGKEPLDFA